MEIWLNSEDMVSNSTVDFRKHGSGGGVVGVIIENTGGWGGCVGLIIENTGQYKAFSITEVGSEDRKLFGAKLVPEDLEL